MGAMTTPMCGAFFLLVVSRLELALYISTAVIGVCTGAITSISVSATTELFGAKNFGVNHNILVSNIPMGRSCLGTWQRCSTREEEEEERIAWGRSATKQLS
ncbi:UNVERIFIED_CONTAM: protein NUCLEAR FUSION defective [Sesamum radiatum]|uniref:Protein NUCLEAR FUSION defective n=1 Tax=Sesamum radiatum TaxID=300843 RepID=A0AAW2VZV4_SESRA